MMLALARYRSLGVGLPQWSATPQRRPAKNNRALRFDRGFGWTGRRVGVAGHCPFKLSGKHADSKDGETACWGKEAKSAHSFGRRQSDQPEVDAGLAEALRTYRRHGRQW
ncbi:hypothetical protein DESC_760041 [Desulfosarcina cetonica]|nr:hypothetical protein DESC_760041 [Desulfosarcina cetonica]